jgi:hypothetical protein
MMTAAGTAVKAAAMVAAEVAAVGMGAGIVVMMGGRIRVVVRRVGVVGIKIGIAAAKKKREPCGVVLSEPLAGALAFPRAAEGDHAGKKAGNQNGDGQWQQGVHANKLATPPTV